MLGPTAVFYSLVDHCYLQFCLPDDRINKDFSVGRRSHHARKRTFRAVLVIPATYSKQRFKCRIPFFQIIELDVHLVVIVLVRGNLEGINE